MINLKPSKLYVYNKTNRRILVHTIVNENRSYNDFLVLKPMFIGEVECLPTVFSPNGNYKNVFVPLLSHKRAAYINAVDFY